MFWILIYSMLIVHSGRGLHISQPIVNPIHGKMPAQSRY
jgi:hypothetical protein